MRVHFALCLAIVGCSHAPPLTEPDFVEVASTRTRDAGHDAEPQDAAADTTLPWWDPYPAGGPLPHPAR